MVLPSSRYSRGNAVRLDCAECDHPGQVKFEPAAKAERKAGLVYEVRNNIGPANPGHQPRVGHPDQAMGKGCCPRGAPDEFGAE